MSASSSAASSTLSRSRTAIAIFTALATVYGIYYINSNAYDPATSQLPEPSSGLRRSNAIHRRRRRTLRTGDATADTAESSQSESDDTDNDGEPIDLRPLADDETVVDSPPFSDDDDSPPWARQRAGQHMVQLLFRISEDATKRNSYVHRGTLCNACGVVPIRGIRYRCANCADYDLCESCESQGHHYRTHVFYKIRVPISNYAPRQLQAPFYPGDPEFIAKMLPRELTTRLTKETGLDRPEIEAYWDQWTYMANTEWRDDPDDLCLAMDRRTFDRCLVPSDGNRYAAPSLIHDRMFAFYDQDGDDLISFPEFLHGLAFRKSKNKLKKVFYGYDINGDGYVDRKDFLRMFRSYYLLYKNMRKDMLDSMDEHAVNSVDAHQLVHSRQPLSSAFGRDGRFGSAASRNIGEGKQLNPEGDLEIIDGKGIVYPSSDDHGDRTDIFRDPVKETLENLPIEAVAGYWRLMEQPPSSMRDLQANLLESLIMRTTPSQRITPSQMLREQEAADEPDSIENPPDWNYPYYVDESDVVDALGYELPTREVPRNQRWKVVEVALRRMENEARTEREEIASARMHERWRRRQFYTDEEEGVEAPADWKEDEDVPKGETKVSDDVPQRPLLSPRSRSSSKVRFAEDMDDYDTRSNPSTSSRSIPERWGGMEIPDAEKDVGKDILYQVTQQAFNDLLDNLFKYAEDTAIASLSSKKARAQHRHLFTNRYFEKWAAKVDRSKVHNEDIGMNLFPAKDRQEEITHHIHNEMREWNTNPSTIAVELEETRQVPLEDLLAQTGYSVEPEPQTSSTIGESSHNPPVANPPIQGAGVPRSARRGSETPSENLRRDLLEAFRSADPGLHAPSPPLPTDEDDFTDMLQSYRDPTLPQFRPSMAPPPVPSPPSPVFQNIPAPSAETTHEYVDVENEDNSREAETEAERSSSSGQRSGKGKSKSKSPSLAELMKPQTPLHDYRTELLAEMETDAAVSKETHRALAQWDWMALYKLREMEATEAQARERGGWARISWGEFEDVLKLRDEGWRREKENLLRYMSGEEEMLKARRREQEVERMVEYLGSWIELCIP